MKFNRQALINVLQSVAPGLAKSDTVEQASCFAFRGNKVFTFNDEVCCWMVLPGGFEFDGAIAAAPLLSLLQKLPDDELRIQSEPEKLIINGARRQGTLNREDVTMPIDVVEEPTAWQDVHEDFIHALKIVGHCAAHKEGDAFALKCVNITPDHVEACDNYQIARYPVPTGVTAPTLIRGECIRHVAQLDATEFCATETWAHFRNELGLTLSCRRYLDQYPELTSMLDDPGETSTTTLPPGLIEVVERCEIFSSENSEGDKVLVRIKDNKVVVTGTGVSGSFKEQRDVKYTGQPVEFMVAPKLLCELIRKHNEAEVNEKRLVIDSGKFKYLTCVEPPQ